MQIFTLNIAEGCQSLVMMSIRSWSVWIDCSDCKCKNANEVPVEDVDEHEEECDEHGHAAGHHLRRDEERGPRRDHKQTWGTDKHLLSFSR